jgi:hypothetical protein
MGHVPHIRWVDAPHDEIILTSTAVKSY